ncbi:zinc ABC transporter substrate-binding protein [Ruegeria sediminis]|uniref:High-affinity zinc uptake system protein ZnuA n=1 Tax=Ruegeria sediminis TaxID=2583820 RepID=A0ABY2X2Y9_9RHOB|nr:zinc ABC transporter substrate-binding protein [Ruegeria sediminis]TMV09740.1 zinc ABC transporter substrate-binding protein [Ruegeria sediminis]
MIRFSLLTVAITWAGAATADGPKVATDIAPVHSLVSQVMEGVGSPDLIIRPGVSPHGYSMRPSEAQALQSADLVVWVGEELAPWMVKPLASLAQGARQLELMDVEGTVHHDFRDLAGHSEERDGHDDAHHGHDEDEHDHEGVDPHAWLDPRNAQVWLTRIAEELSDIDPQNAAIYRDNATVAHTRLEALEGELSASLVAMQDVRYISFHDAYQYFEKRFGLEPVGTISLSDASSPGPARLAALRERIAKKGASCAFSEPQFDTRLFNAALGQEAVQIHELDPLGARLEPGPNLYPALLQSMADSFAACAKGD